MLGGKQVYLNILKKVHELLCYIALLKQKGIVL